PPTLLAAALKRIPLAHIHFPIWRTRHRQRRMGPISALSSVNAIVAKMCATDVEAGVNVRRKL
ncbi:hypothetical protein SARC_16841, partial [Sphaeroforma arctica JP610]